MAMAVDNGTGLSERNRLLRNRCVHLWITHEPAFPYGCRALGFKSRQLPSLAVMDASGQECLHFQEKTKGSALGHGR